MSRIRSEGTKLEANLEKILESIPMPLVKHPKLFGKPDFGYLELKIAIFADSDFWHGYSWEIKRNEIKSNKDFWIKKIEGNMRRDQQVTKQLENEGWQVIRLWGHDINRQPNKCQAIIEEAVNIAKAKQGVNSQKKG